MVNENSISTFCPAMYDMVLISKCPEHPCNGAAISLTYHSGLWNKLHTTQPLLFHGCSYVVIMIFRYLHSLECVAATPHAGYTLQTVPEIH